MGHPASLPRWGEDPEIHQGGSSASKLGHGDPGSIWTWPTQVLTLPSPSHLPYPTVIPASMPQFAALPTSWDPRLLSWPQSGSRAWNMPSWYLLAFKASSLLLQGVFLDALTRLNVLFCMISKLASCLWHREDRWLPSLLAILRFATQSTQYSQETMMNELAEGNHGSRGGPESSRSHVLLCKLGLCT